MHQSASTLLNRLFARARFRHVQVLVQLAELGSVRRTAEAIGMTQPGVTQLLADLETMLETPLFHRHARGVKPTPACADLLPTARQLLLGLATTAEAVAARRGLGEGVVRVAGTTSAVNGLLVRALPKFNDAHPSVQVHLGEADRDDLLLAASHGELDMVCCRRTAVVPEGWVFQVLAGDEFVVACGAQHPLARKRQVAMKELAQETWLPAPAGSAAREQFDTLSRGFKQPPRICNVITRVPAATWALLRHKQLLTVVPAGVVRQLVEAGQLAVLKLDEQLPLEPLGMLLPLRDMTSATARLAEFLRRFAGRNDKGNPRPVAEASSAAGVQRASRHSTIR